MSAAEKKIVWVLGAGFSRPLGGPLLQRLLAPVSYRDLQPHYGQLDGDRATKWVRDLYLYGREYKAGRTADQFHLDGEPLWEDAEQFIDYLDTACATPPVNIVNARAVRIAAILKRFKQDRLTANPMLPADPPTIPELRVAARTHIAAECCAFLREASLQSELWSPYLRWADALKPTDSIITFNYDCVLERLPPGLHFVLPGEDPSYAEHETHVFKLHGSTDWIRRSGYQRNHGFERTHQFDFAVGCADAERVIATPGPTKLDATSNALAPLWDLACDRLREADIIVFVGYRFPPTDSYARQRLLRAIGKNDGAKHLRVHIVLGDDHEAERRLASLLRHTLRGGGRFAGNESGDGTRNHYSVSAQGLFSQDFLSVFDRDVLSAPLWDQTNVS